MYPRTRETSPDAALLKFLLHHICGCHWPQPVIEQFDIKEWRNTLFPLKAAKENVHGEVEEFIFCTQKLWPHLHLSSSFIAFNFSSPIHALRHVSTPIFYTNLSKEPILSWITNNFVFLLNPESPVHSSSPSAFWNYLTLPSPLILMTLIFLHFLLAILLAPLTKRWVTWRPGLKYVF